MGSGTLVAVEGQACPPQALRGTGVLGRALPWAHLEIVPFEKRMMQKMLLSVPQQSLTGLCPPGEKLGDSGLEISRTLPAGRPDGGLAQGVAARPCPGGRLASPSPL